MNKLTDHPLLMTCVLKYDRLMKLPVKISAGNIDEHKNQCRIIFEFTEWNGDEFCGINYRSAFFFQKSRGNCEDTHWFEFMDV